MDQDYATYLGPTAEPLERPETRADKDTITYEWLLSAAKWTDRHLSEAMLPLQDIEYRDTGVERFGAEIRHLQTVLEELAEIQRRLFANLAWERDSDLELPS